MRKSSIIYVMAFIAVLFSLSIGGCRTTDQFVDGLAAVSGRGGTIAREDVFDETAALAEKLNQGQPPTKWETRVESEATDFISFLDSERVLVGTVVSGSYLGVPNHDEIKLYNVKTGQLIWSAKRDGLENGHYALLTTEPLILLVGRDDSATQFVAFDPESGEQKWTYRVEAPDHFAVSEGLDRIVSISAGGKGRSVRVIDVKDGRQLWERSLPETSVTDTHQDILIVKDGAAFVIGSEIVKLDIRDGSSLWTSRHPVLRAGDLSVHHSSLGLLAYSADGMALINPDDGSILWDLAETKMAVRFAAVLDDRLYRVIAAKAGQQNGDMDSVQALNPRTGRVLWSRSIKGRIVSPLYEHKGVITFTTDSAIYGIVAKSGKQRFRNPFAKQFRLGGPSSAKMLKRPDRILFRKEKFYLIREMAGIRAYAFPSGAKLWEQLNFDHKELIYSADWRYSALSRNLKSNLSQQNTEVAPSPGVRSESQSLFIRSAQRRYESEQQRTAAVLSNSYATRSDRASAQQSRVMNAQLMAANRQVDMAMSQMQAAGDLFNSVVGLQGAIQKAIETAAIEGVISRKQLELKKVMGLQNSCIQAKYYLWPFFFHGRGVTLVDLDSGKRHDLIFSPQLLPLDVYGIDLPTFRIAPDGETLLMSGVGMDSKKYEEYVKWKYRMPKPSILAYDLSAFSFTQKSLTQSKAEREAAEAKEKEKAFVRETQAIYEELNSKAKIHMAAQYGNLKLVRSLLDSGVSANAPHPQDQSGPLIFAVIGGNPDVVRLLIERGADIDAKTKEGKTALDIARLLKHRKIVDLLKQAGAR
jgi:outer membrane protein assembly factor BamB